MELYDFYTGKCGLLKKNSEPIAGGCPLALNLPLSMMTEPSIHGENVMAKVTTVRAYSSAAFWND